MKRFLLSALMGVFAVTLYANQADSVVVMEKIIVSTTKMNVNRAHTPMTISVIERKDIEASSESALLPVLSQRVPGLFVTQRGVTGFGVSAGAAGSMNMRGVGQGNKVLVLFDGQPQWAGIFGHSLPDTYVASDVERVEVVRGPGSFLYGSNAMGGVVNIITRSESEDGLHTRIRAMAGSYGTQKYLINNGYKKGKLSTFVSINHDRTDGHRPNSNFHITNGFAKIGYKFNNVYKATADVSLANYRAENPGVIMNQMNDNVMKVWRGTASAALENNHKNVYGALRFFYNWGDHKINDGYAASQQPKTYLFRSLDHNFGVMFYESLRLFKGNEFTVGLDYKNWGGNAWNAFFDGQRVDIVDKNIDETAAYISMQQRFGVLAISTGVRYEYNSMFDGVLIPQAGVTVTPFTGNVIKALVSKGFRSPNIREMFMYPVQNKSLNPENMLNYELSVGQYFVENKVYLQATAFYIDGRNMIETIMTNEGMKNWNVGRFYNSGFEFEADYNITNGLNFTANYSYLNTNKRLLAAPRHKVFAMLSYDYKRFSVSVNTQSISGLYVDPSLKSTQSYMLLNARGSYDFGLAKIFVKGENLTSRAYSINYGFPMPGVVILSGIELEF